MLKRKVLHGKTVLVTRPRTQAIGLVNLLRRHGAQVLTTPAIRITHPTSWSGLDRALKRHQIYDTIIFTSSNGVDGYFQRASKIFHKRPSQPHRIYAIGPQTAKSLRQHGWRGIGVPDQYEGKALANRLGQVRGHRILIPRAKKARDVLPRLLKRRGALVDVVEVYQTISDVAGLKQIRRAIEQNIADVVTFTSSSTVEHFMKAAPSSQTKNFFHRAIAASIGPITSTTLRDYGVSNILEAKTYTTKGLVHAILNAQLNGKH